MLKRIKFFLKFIFLKINFYYEEYFISKKRKKKFKKDFNILFKKLKEYENFAFLRFSDGELFVLQNKKLIISKRYWVLEDKKYFAKFNYEETKKFLPSKHQFYQKKLYQSLIFEKKIAIGKIISSC